MYSAPWDFNPFSDKVKCLRVLFYFKAVPIISPPVIPISLSYNNFNDLYKNNSTYNLISSIYLFYNIIEAIHLAPSIPIEFFLILPS